MRVTLLALFAALALCGPLAAQTTGKRHALLVGVGKYGSDALSNLRFPEADVRDLAKVFSSDRFRPSEVTVLSTDSPKSSPTAARVRAALQALLANVGADDIVIVGFSGHGVQIGKAFYFCPVGADPANPETLVSLSDVYDQLGRCKARHRFLFADACRNDPGKALNLFPAVDPKPAPQRVPLPENTAAFFSGSPGEKSFESDALGHGLFFHFVIDGLGGKADLNGDTKVTRPELDAHVRWNPSVSMAADGRRAALAAGKELHLFEPDER